MSDDGPLSVEERYELRLHTTQTGMRLLDRLLFEHDKLAAIVKKRKKRGAVKVGKSWGTHEMNPEWTP